MTDYKKLEEKDTWKTVQFMTVQFIVFTLLAMAIYDDLTLTNPSNSYIYGASRIWKWGDHVRTGSLSYKEDMVIADSCAPVPLQGFEMVVDLR